MSTVDRPVVVTSASVSSRALQVMAASSPLFSIPFSFIVNSQSKNQTRDDASFLFGLTMKGSLFFFPCLLLSSLPTLNRLVFYFVIAAQYCSPSLVTFGPARPLLLICTFVFYLSCRPLCSPDNAGLLDCCPRLIVCTSTVSFPGAIPPSLLASLKKIHRDRYFLQSLPSFPVFLFPCPPYSLPVACRSFL